MCSPTWFSLSRDQIASTPGCQDGMNLYQYVHSSPQNSLDPSGQLIQTPGLIGAPVFEEVAPALCTPVGAAATACVVGPIIGYTVGEYTTGPLTKKICDWYYRPCPSCPEPPPPRTDTTHDHGDCFKKTGSNTHWHYFRFNQNPETCESFLQKIFGGCGPVPSSE